METYLRRALTALYDAAASGEPIPDQLKIDARLAASTGTAAGVRITQRAFNACTTAALRNGSRLHVTVAALQAHMLTGETSLIQLGAFLGEVPGTHIGQYL